MCRVNALGNVFAGDDQLADLQHATAGRTLREYHGAGLHRKVVDGVLEAVEIQLCATLCRVEQLDVCESADLIAIVPDETIFIRFAADDDGAANCRDADFLGENETAGLDQPSTLDRVGLLA